MNSFHHDLRRYISIISSGQLPRELPPDVLCRQELQGVIDRISSLTDEISQLKAEATTLKSRHDQISTQEHLYRSVFDLAVVGIMIVSPDGMILDANQAVEYMLGSQVDELRQMSVSDFTLPEDHKLDVELQQDVIEGIRNYYHIEKRYIRNDGMLFWALVTVFVVRNDTGTISLVHMLEDISARKSAEIHLEQKSTHDAMTGLYNRAYFDREFISLQHSIRFPVSIVVIDVDGLKQLNDTQGHKAGDRLIVGVASILKEAFRGDDTVARVGGDEFTILLPETGQKGLKAVIEHLCQCQARFNEADPTFPIHFSTGTATAFTGDEIPNALKQADERMYADKLQRKALRATYAV